MGMRFHSFVILAGMRTGSNLLEANLNAFDGVTCYGEVFNPHFIGKKNSDELFGVTLSERERDPKPLLERMQAETVGLSGFRFFFDHDPRVLATVLADPGCAKIILTRNPIDSYVSLGIARTTGQWKLADAKRLKSAIAHFDEQTFTKHLQDNQEFHLRVLNALQISGQTAFVLDYEDLTSIAVLNGLAAFLGVSERLKSVDDTLKKQNPQPLEQKLDNAKEMEQALARADLFGLARTPIFEPRRPVNFPDSVALDSARLLFLPVSSSPTEEVIDWMSALGALTQGLDAKSIRQWKREHPGHRSFSVIRHPVLRAYHAFHSRIVSGALPGHRNTLIRAYGAKLPEPGDPFPDAAAEKRAFLVFLNYARLSVLGQCGQRVDAHWASQTAILQGLANFQPVDFVIREAELRTFLPILANDPAAATKWRPAPDQMAASLLSIYDARVEAAAAAAYARDYMGFGFGAWNNQAAC